MYFYSFFVLKITHYTRGTFHRSTYSMMKCTTTSEDKKQTGLANDFKEWWVTTLKFLQREVLMECGTVLPKESQKGSGIGSTSDDRR